MLVPTGDVVRGAKMGLRKSCTLNVSVHAVKIVIFLCGKGDLLVKTGQSVCQFYVKATAALLPTLTLLLHLAPFQTPLIPFSKKCLVTI